MLCIYYNNNLFIVLSVIDVRYFEGLEGYFFPHPVRVNYNSWGIRMYVLCQHSLAYFHRMTNPLLTLNLVQCTAQWRDMQCYYVHRILSQTSHIYTEITPCNNNLQCLITYV